MSKAAVVIYLIWSWQSRESTMLEINLQTIKVGVF